MPGALSWIDRELLALEAKGLRRTLEPLGGAQGPVIELGGRHLVNLCSNDYLGLAAGGRPGQAAASAAHVAPAPAGRAAAVSSARPTPAPIRDGCRLSLAKTLRYPHCDLGALAR